MTKISEVTFNDISTIIKNGYEILRGRDYLDPLINAGEIPANTPDYHETIKITYCGKLEELEFIKRIFNLKQLPSSYDRFETAEQEIWQHTINNPNDFPEYWFFDYEPFDFKDNDHNYLKFLCEMFHPAVRNEYEPWKEFLDILNDLLKPDGYEIYPKSKISGRDVYGWHYISSNEIEIEVLKQIDSSYIRQIAERAKLDIISGEYDSALTKSRTLLEEAFCYIIEENGETPSEKGDIGDLFNQVKKLYNMHQKKEADIRINALLFGLEKILSSIGIMRSKAGDSHGVGSKRYNIEEHHARLYVNSAITFAEFILSVHLKKRGKG